MNMWRVEESIRFLWWNVCVSLPKKKKNKFHLTKRDPHERLSNFFFLFVSLLRERVAFSLSYGRNSVSLSAHHFLSSLSLSLSFTLYLVGSLLHLGGSAVLNQKKKEVTNEYQPHFLAFFGSTDHLSGTRSPHRHCIAPRPIEKKIRIEIKSDINDWTWNSKKNNVCFEGRKINGPVWPSDRTQRRPLPLKMAIDFLRTLAVVFTRTATSRSIRRAVTDDPARRFASVFYYFFFRSKNPNTEATPQPFPMREREREVSMATAVARTRNFEWITIGRSEKWH